MPICLLHRPHCFAYTAQDKPTILFICIVTFSNKFPLQSNLTYIRHHAATIQCNERNESHGSIALDEHHQAYTKQHIGQHGRCSLRGWMGRGGDSSISMWGTLSKVPDILSTCCSVAVVQCPMSNVPTIERTSHCCSLWLGCCFLACCNARNLISCRRRRKQCARKVQVLEK